MLIIEKPGATTKTEVIPVRVKPVEVVANRIEIVKLTAETKRLATENIEQAQRIDQLELSVSPP